MPHFVHFSSRGMTRSRSTGHLGTGPQGVDAVASAGWMRDAGTCRRGGDLMVVEVS